MALPGDVAVNQGGAAGYTIPIIVPPGTAGVAPGLSLSYNSQRGNGILGMGWSLDGLPALARCAKTMAQDGAVGAVRFDADDRFCLDGQKLIATSGTYGADGTQYRTELESFSKIISHGTTGNGPTWFEVRTKSGQTLHFGNSTDSRALSQGGSVRSWSVNKVSDTKGNYFTVSYTQDVPNGQVYPNRIDYTGNAAASLSPYNSVQFVYDTTRPDPTIAYIAGTLIKTTVRLTNVRAYSGATLVNDYQVQYQQTPAISLSTATSIKLCVQGGACLPATTFTWPNADGAGFAAPVTWQHNANYNNWIRDVGDFNGDGRIDLVLYVNNVNGWYTYIALSNGDGTFATPVSWQALGNYSGLAFNAGDFNGDGRADLMLHWSNPRGGPGFNGASVSIALSNGDGTFGSPTTWQPNGTFTGTFSPGDFNGDGRTDLMLYEKDANSWRTWVMMSNGDGTFSTPVQWQSTGNYNGLNFVAGDFNGDGRTDIALHKNDDTAWKVWVAFSNGDGTFNTPVAWQANGIYGPLALGPQFRGAIDFNGDGRSDLILQTNGRTFWRSYVALSKGDGTFADPVLWEAAGSFYGWSFITGDFNGDGRADQLLYANSQAGWYAHVALSKGDGTFTAPVVWQHVANYTGLIFAAGDFNGDGRTDITLLWNNSSAWQARTALTSIQPYSLTAVTHGLGAQTTITYKTLAQPGAPYTKDTGAVYPTVEFQGALYVVSQLQKSNGIGGTVSSNYTYAGARGNSAGHGLLGFREVKVTDSQTGIEQTITYRQDFPFIGLTATETKKLGALTLNQVTNSYQFKDASGGTTISPTSAPYQVFLTQSQAASADLDGSVMPLISSTYQYDAYGNALQIVLSTSDGHTKTTTNTFSNDVTNWLLGRLTAASVSSTTP